jgi:hypothetical protein
MALQITSKLCSASLHFYVLRLTSIFFTNAFEYVIEYNRYRGKHVPSVHSCLQLREKNRCYHFAVMNWAEIKMKLFNFHTGVKLLM